MIQINLIPDVKKQLIHAQYVRSRVITGSIIVSIVAVGIVLLLATYTYGYQTIRNATLDSSIEKEDKKLQDVADLSKVLTIQNQLSVITSLHDSKKINSRFYDMINRINPSQPNSVKYNSITIDSTQNKVVIEGQTSGFPAYETFKKTLSNAQVSFIDTQDDNQQKTVALASNISIPETSFGVDSAGVQVLRFTISFTYADEFLSPLAKDAKITIPGSGNVTDSYQGVPQSLFTDKASDISGGR